MIVNRNMLNLNQLIWFLIIIIIHALLAVTTSEHQNSTATVGKLVSAQVVRIFLILLIIITMNRLIIEFVY